MPRRLLLFALLALSVLLTAHSQAQIVLPAEFGIGQAVSEPALRPSKIFNPSIASNGESFFAAWNDGRYGNPDEFGARMTAAGELMDAEPATIVATWKWDSPGAVVAGNGESVVFTKTEMGGGFLNRVLEDGSVLGAGTIEGLTPLAGAWNGSRYAVVCSATRETPLQLQFFGAGLERLERVPLGESENASLSAAVAAGNGRFLAVWEDTRLSSNVTRVLGQCFDDHGSSLTPVFEIGRVVTATFDPYATGPAVSWNGTNYVVVYTEPGVLRSATVSAEGIVQPGFVLGSPIYPQSIAGSAAIAWDGQTHLVVWIANGAYQAITVDASGGVHQGFTLPVPVGASTRPAIASNGERFLVIAGDHRIAVQPNAQERALDLGPITSAYLEQMDPVITAGTSELLTAWIEGSEVYASRISAAGQRMGDAIHLGHGASYGYVHSITASSAGDRHFVAWRDFDEKRSHVVLIDGTSLKELNDTPVTPSSPLYSSASATGFGLLWTEPTEPQSYYSGTLVIGLFDRDAYRRAVVVGTGAYGVAVDSFTWAGDAYAVLWRNKLNAPCLSGRCPIEYEHRLTRVNEDGTILSDVVLPKSNLLAATVDARGALLVSYVVVTNYEAEVVAQRFAFDGTLTSTVKVFDYTLWSLSGVLKPAPWGYTLIRNVYLSETAQWETAIEHLDPEGHLIERLVRPRGSLNDAVSAFGTIWITYTAQWRPLAGAHSGVVSRAFYRPLVTRTRAARR